MLPPLILNSTDIPGPNSPIVVSMLIALPFSIIAIGIVSPPSASISSSSVAGIPGMNM